MVRRKLTVFTVMYIAGIAAGYFMLEKIRPVEAACFMISCALAALFSGINVKTIRAMICIMLAGFMLFTLRFALGENSFDDNTEQKPGAVATQVNELKEAFIGHFDKESGAFIQGVVFGDKEDIDENLKDEFNVNQTGHILAVSGLHVGFLYSLLRILTGRKRTVMTSALIITILLLYGTMTMWSAPTIRACIVMCVSLLAIHFRRRADLLTSVSLAAFLILTFDPHQLFEVGFQMSMLTMTSIAILTKPLSMKLGETLGMMAAVQVGIVPITAYVFCRTNPLSLLINVPIVLLASVFVPLCILLLMFQVAFGVVPAPGIKLAELIADAVIRVNHMLCFDGGFSMSVAGLSSLSVITFYVAVFGASSEWMRIMLIRKDRKSIAKACILLSLPVIMLSACLFDRLSDDEVLFPYVGQGDCTHVRAGDDDMLIDGGGNEMYNVGEKVLMPYLLKCGADDVDVALVTHLHTDHFRGICELSHKYPVGAVGIPSDYRGAEVDLDRNKVFYLNLRSKISLSDDVYVSVLWPIEESAVGISADDENEHNMVYMIHYKGVRIMVTGDLLEEDELEMVDFYRHNNMLRDLRCDVLKVAHHGSKSSSSEAFLDAAKPSVAVISVGRNNLYGHPHEQTLERLMERGIRVYRTDINGTVGIDVRSNKIIVDTLQNVVK